MSYLYVKIKYMDINIYMIFVRYNKSLSNYQFKRG